MTASYSALLFVHWNSSLATYLSFMPDGEVRMAAIHALVAPQAPSVLTVHIGSVTSAMSVGGPIGYKIHEGLGFDCVFR
jgi:hypothetical protein